MWQTIKCWLGWHPWRAWEVFVNRDGIRQVEIYCPRCHIIEPLPPGIDKETY